MEQTKVSKPKVATGRTSDKLALPLSIRKITRCKGMLSSIHKEVRRSGTSHCQAGKIPAVTKDLDLKTHTALVLRNPKVNNRVRQHKILLMFMGIPLEHP